LQQDDSEYGSDLEQNSSKFSYFSIDRDVHHVYDHFPNLFEYTSNDGCIDDYMFLVDYNLDVLNHAVQTSCDHLYEEEVVVLDDQELLMKEQGGHLFLSKGEFMQRQSFFLNQHVFEYGFEDPVAALLESYLSDFLKISHFIISLALRGEYDSLKMFLLLLPYLCYSLLISAIDEIISVIKLLEWLLWKSAFT